MTMISSIDLATTWGPTQVQGNRPTCLAFVASELNRHLSGSNSALSAEYIYRVAARKSVTWTAGAGLRMAHLSEALVQHGQPADADCPYLAHEPLETPPNVPNLPESAKLYTATVQLISKATQIIEAELQQGKPVGLILKLTDTFLKPIQGKIDFSHMLLSINMHHAVVATGLGKHSHSGEPHFRIRNTWGETWGDQGCAWLPHSYVQSHAVTAFKV